MRSGSNWYQIGNKKLTHFQLSGLKVLSLACKCVFYRAKHNAKGEPMELNFEVLEVEKWNILTDKAQQLDEKNCIHLSIYHVYSQSYGH